MLREELRKIFYPLPKDQKEQGFKPNFYIRFLRGISKFLIFLLRLNGKNRFSNEFIQMLDPVYAVRLNGGKEIKFRTGHGRLLWRAREFFNEEPLMLKWIDSFEKDDIFYDIGANVGNYSIYAAMKGIKTTAFEAEYLNLSLLYENIFLNGVQGNCMIIPIALSDRAGTDIFYLKDVSKGDALHGLGKKSYLLPVDKEILYKLRVLTLSGDSLIDIFGLDKPTKIKIDVDSNELEIVRGFSNAIKESVSEIYIEIDGKNEEHREIFDILKSFGFEPYTKEDIGKEWNRGLFNYIFRKKRF